MEGMRIKRRNRHHAPGGRVAPTLCLKKASSRRALTKIVAKEPEENIKVDAASARDKDERPGIRRTFVIMVASDSNENRAVDFFSLARACLRRSGRRRTRVERHVDDTRDVTRRKCELPSRDTRV